MSALIDAALWVIAPTVVLIALVGLGDPFLPRSAHLPIHRTVAAGLVGLLVLMAVVPLWNLFLPVGVHSGAYTLTAGIGVAALRRSSTQLSLQMILRFLAAAILVAFLYRISSPVIPIRFLTDTIVYHLSHAEWIAREPMPLGTGNIQTRLGLNPGFFTLASALRFAPLGQTHLFVTEVAVRALFILVVIDVFKSAREKSDQWLRAFVLSTAVMSLPFFAINKSGTDGNVGFLLLSLVLIAATLFGSEATEERSDGTVLLIALIGLVSTLKLSSATAALLLLPLVTRARRVRAGALLSRRSLPLASLTFLAGFGWALKSFASTGCFLFPVSASCTPVSWGVGDIAADVTATLVTSFARRSDWAIGEIRLMDLDWIATWLPTYLTSVPALVVLAAAPVAVIGWARTSGALLRSRLPWLLLPLAAAPAILVALSVADLLGGRRFLGVDPAIVGVLADYPNARMLLLSPLIAIGVLLLAAAASPVRRRDALDALSGEELTALRGLIPYLLITFAYWFVTAPATRFAWAPHVLVSATLLTRWTASLDIERVVPHLPATARAAGLAGGVACIIAVGVVQPVLPIFAPEVEEEAAFDLGPVGLTVRVPPSVDDCATLFPCAPVPVEGLSARRALGRLVIVALSHDESRVLEELGIRPRR